MYNHDLELSKAVAEHHPKLEILRELSALAEVLPTREQELLQNCLARVLLPDTPKTSVSISDPLFLTVLEFCNDCVDKNLTSLNQQSVHQTLSWTRTILYKLEENWHADLDSNAVKAANKALDWLLASLGNEQWQGVEAINRRRWKLRH